MLELIFLRSVHTVVRGQHSGFSADMATSVCLRQHQLIERALNNITPHSRAFGLPYLQQGMSGWILSTACH